MIKSFVFALGVTALALGTFTAKVTTSNSHNAVMMASGGSNCPVYYGCPAPPPPAPKGGGNSGGGNSGGGNTGGGKGGADNTLPHA